MRLVTTLCAVAFVASGCDPVPPDAKAHCASDDACADGSECVDGVCVPSGTGGGGGGGGGGSGGGGTCVARGEEACNGVDDDCDGVTDPSSCPWHYGLPMPLVELHTGLGDHLHPHASRDGLRLYYGAFDPSGAATTVVATRASRDERFLAEGGPGEPFATPAVVEGLAPLGAPGAATFSPTELEGFIQVREPSHPHHFDIAQRTRGARDAAFTDAGLVPAASRSGVDEIQPFISRDGRELFFSANPLPSNRYRLFRVARDEAGSFAPEASELTLLGVPPSHADFSPFLADDGETLFYESIRRAGEGPVLMRAVRARSGDPNVFDVAGPLPERVNVVLSGEPFLSESTGELFFVSTQPGSPASIAIWRMRVCRDAPCPEEPPAPCPVGAARTARSPDGRHCYAILEAASDFDGARSACEDAGGTLASVHDGHEASRLASLLARGPAWIGGFDRGGDVFAWTSGEPFLFAPWADASPSRGSGCVALGGDVDVDFDERDCATALPALCEVETYPTW